MVCEPDIITTGEAMHMKYTAINSGWYIIWRDYLLNIVKCDCGVFLNFRYLSFIHNQNSFPWIFT